MALIYVAKTPGKAFQHLTQLFKREARHFVNVIGFGVEPSKFVLYRNYRGLDSSVHLHDLITDLNTMPAKDCAFSVSPTEKV